jgi:uncharacterized protein
MSTDLQRYRFLRRQLERPLAAPRLILLTGARQTGKTTLAKAVYPGLRYVNLDAPGDSRALREVGRALGSAWRGGLVIHSGSRIERLEEKIWAVPVDRLLV